MKELNRLAEEIFNEVLGTDDEVTMEEALEMAKMEMKSKKLTRYEKSDTPRKKSARERKVDNDKKYLLGHLQTRLLTETDSHDFTVKNEAEFSFTFKSNSYTVKLIKHRAPK